MFNHHVCQCQSLHMHVSSCSNALAIACNVLKKAQCCVQQPFWHKSAASGVIGSSRCWLTCRCILGSSRGLAGVLLVSVFRQRVVVGGHFLSVIDCVSLGSTPRDDGVTYTP